MVDDPDPSCSSRMACPASSDHGWLEGTGVPCSLDGPSGIVLQRTRGAKPPVIQRPGPLLGRELLRRAARADEPRQRLEVAIDLAGIRGRRFQRSQVSELNGHGGPLWLART